MLLTHENKVELDYLSLFNMGIHVPEIGSAIDKDTLEDFNV